MNEQDETTPWGETRPIQQNPSDALEREPAASFLRYVSLSPSLEILQRVTEREGGSAGKAGQRTAQQCNVIEVQTNSMIS